MTNQTIYSSNPPDGGSDMDVSESDEEIRVQQTPNPTPRPHAKMVVSLHNYMKKDSWGKNAIRTRTENIIQPKPIKPNPTSYASIAASEERKEDEDSDTSFHTAPNSPADDTFEPGQLDSQMDIEPGQITEVSPINPYEQEYEALEKQLIRNDEIEAQLEKEIKACKETQEAIRIQLLELKVRNSIARNRKPVVKTDSTNEKVALIQQPVTALQQPNIVGQPIPQSTTLQKPSNKKQDKGKARADIRQSDQVNETTESTTPEKKPQPNFLISAEINIPNPPPSPLSKKARKRANKLLAAAKAALNDEPLITNPTLKRPIGESDTEVKTKKPRSEPPIDHGNRLIDAVIDKPLSKKYIKRPREPNDTSDDSIDSKTKNERKKERKEREREELISAEERLLIEPDVPPYPGYQINGRKELSRNAFRLVNEYLTNNPPSLKEMRLTLLNLKEASVEQNGRLTIEQEEFVKGLIRKIQRMIEDYMTLSDEAYARSLRKLQKNDSGPDKLPDHFYGNLATLNFDRPDLSHHELYKTILHFESIINTSAKRKSQQFLLKSGRVPNQRILRTCDPADREDKDATLSSDETTIGREIKLVNLNKPPKTLEKSVRKKEKRKINASLKRDFTEENRKLAKEIDDMANQIAINMQFKKNQLGPSQSKPSTPPQLSEVVKIESLEEPPVSHWKPKPEPKTPTNFAQQFNHTMHPKINPIVIDLDPIHPTISNTKNNPIIIKDSPTETLKLIANPTKNNPIVIKDSTIQSPKPVNHSKYTNNSKPTDNPSVTGKVLPETIKPVDIIAKFIKPVPNPIATGNILPQTTEPVNINAQPTKPAPKPVVSAKTTKPVNTNAQPLKSASKPIVSAKTLPQTTKPVNTNLQPTKPASTPITTPIIINNNPASKNEITTEKYRYTENTNSITEDNTSYYKPYKSVLNSLGLTHTEQKPSTQPKSSTLCSAESSGGVCKDKNCYFTHFRDYK